MSSYTILDAFKELDKLSKNKIINEAIKRFNNQPFTVIDKSWLRDDEKAFLQNAQLVDINNNPIVWFHGSNYDNLDYNNAGAYAKTDTYFFSNSQTFASQYTDYDQPLAYFINCKNVFDWRNKKNIIALCNAADSVICEDREISPEQFKYILQTSNTIHTLDKNSFVWLNKYKPFDTIQCPSYLFKALASLSNRNLWPNLSYFIAYDNNTTNLTFIKYVKIKELNLFVRNTVNEFTKLFTSHDLTELKQGNKVECQVPVTLVMRELESDTSFNLGLSKKKEDLKKYSGKTMTCITSEPIVVNMLETFGNIKNTEARENIWGLFEGSAIIKNNIKYNLIDFIKQINFDGILITEVGSLNLIIFDKNNAKRCLYEL